MTSVSTEEIERLLAAPGAYTMSNEQSIQDALIMCLSPARACRSLDLTFQQAYSERRVLLRKISRDIERHRLPAHDQLLRRLEHAISTLPGPKRNSALNTLLTLAEKLPGREENRILDRFARSRSATFRGQVYRRLKATDARVVPEFVVQAWQAFGDFEAARLLVSRASVSVLRKHFAQLETGVRDTGWLLGRLYLRLGGRAPATLARLRRLDPLTYAYVCVKLGRKAPKTLMRSILHGTAGQEIFGLAAWCCGQMGYKDVLADARGSLRAVRRQYEAAGVAIRSALGA